MFGLIAKFIASKISGWLAIVLLLGLLGWGLYAGLIRPITKPNPTTTQHAANISNTTYNIKIGLGGCARIPQATDKK